VVTGLLPWTRGAAVVLGTPQGYRGPGVFDHFWEIVEYFRICYFAGVPTIFAALLSKPIGKNDISSLVNGLCGGAPMPVELFRDFEKATGLPILEGYGLTESACTASANPTSGERRVGSIGYRLPYQKMQAARLADNGKYLGRAEVDEVGAILIHGPNVFAGYLDEMHNRTAWVEIDGERWLNTGDLGREDADQYFWLTGRKKELIIRGGHNIDPKQIEEAIQAHPAVSLVAAIGSPDAHAGEVPVAYVQLIPGAHADAAELLDFATQYIAERPAVPKRIEIVDTLPLTAVGKIAKPALQMLEIARVIRCEATDAGIGEISVEVTQDRRRGLVARIQARDRREQLAIALGRYTFNFEWV
jgi:fatty-acyl-CoA synthase